MRQGPCTVLAMLVVAAAGCLSTAQVMADEPSSGGITVEGVGTPGQASPSPDEYRARIAGVLLYTNLTVSFDDVPARDALRQFRDALDLNMIPLYARQDEEGNTVSPGIDPEHGITLHAENLPALTILKMILLQCEEHEDVTWQIRDAGFMEVGPKSRLNRGSAIEVRTYDVSDLLGMARLLDYRDTGSDAPAVGFSGFGTPYDLYDPRTMISDDGRIVWPVGVHRPRTRAVHSIPHAPQRPQATPPRRPTDPRDAMPRDRRHAEEDLLTLIRSTIEPTLWEHHGGNVAHARIHRDHLVVRAPDYVHRQLGGYPNPVVPDREPEAPDNEQPGPDDTN